MNAVLVWTPPIEVFCLWSPSNTVKWCKEATEEYPIRDQPLKTNKMWFSEKHIPTFLHTYNQEHVNINTAIHSSLEPTSPPSPHVSSVQHTETRDWGEGLVDKLAEASRGFLISGWGQVGIGRWTAYATTPTDRETNPHFISHICSTEPQ